MAVAAAIAAAPSAAAPVGSLRGATGTGLSLPSREAEHVKHESLLAKLTVWHCAQSQSPRRPPAPPGPPLPPAASLPPDGPLPLSRQYSTRAPCPNMGSCPRVIEIRLSACTAQHVVVMPGTTPIPTAARGRGPSRPIHPRPWPKSPPTPTVTNTRMCAHLCVCVCVCARARTHAFVSLALARIRHERAGSIAPVARLQTHTRTHTRTHKHTHASTHAHMPPASAPYPRRRARETRPSADRARSVQTPPHRICVLRADWRWVG